MEQEERDPTQNGAQDVAADPAAEGGDQQPEASEQPSAPEETTAAEETPASEAATADVGAAPAESADAPAGEEAPPAASDAQEPEGTQEGPGEPGAGEAARTKLAELAADARYSATGKRKSAVARVILLPGSGRFELNGRELAEYFPRGTHQAVVKQPLEVSGFVGRIDVRARIHGGGISGQADAVRHGIARALIEADPSLRGELKRRQLLTRDPRVKERRKAGLKKARKRPQFSKR